MDNAELFNIIINEDMLTEKSLDAMMYGVMPSNWIQYKTMVNQKDFLSEMYEAEKKRPLNRAAFLLPDKHEKFLKMLSEVFVEISETCMDPNTNLEQEIESDKSRIKSVFLKQVQLFINELEHAQNETDEENDWIENTIITRDDLVAHLGFAYYLSRNIDPDDTKAIDFREKYQILIEALRDRYFMQIKLEQSIEKQQQMLSTIDQLQKETANKNKIIEEKKKELIKLNDMKSKIEKKYKTLTKSTTGNEAKAIGEKVKELKEKISQLESENARLTASTVSKVTHNKLLLEYNDIKSRKEDLLREKTQLSNIVQELRSRSLVQDLENYLKVNGLTDELLQVIHPYYILYTEGKKPMEMYEDRRTSNIIGYCLVKRLESLGSAEKASNYGHYIIDEAGNANRIFNIPDTSYIGQGQFILVDKEYNFIRNFNYHYSKNDTDGDVTQFGIVAFYGDSTKVELQSGEIVEASNKKYKVLQPGRMVGLNSDFEIIKVYKSIHFNADLFLDSALVRGQQAYLIEHVIEDGCLTRNISTEKEQFMKISGTNELKPQTILFLKDDEVVNQIDSAHFYTTSACYPRSEIGSVFLYSEVAFFERPNGERLIIKHMPDDLILQDGDTVKLDEFGGLICVVEMADTSPFFEKGPTKAKYKYEKVNNLSDGVDHNEEALERRSEQILIVGNKAFENAYKLTMLKSGFSAEVVDGFDSWHKIAKVAREADIIVISTEHLSHTNYYRIKSEFTDKKIIYSELEGVNRIIDKVILEVDGSGDPCREELKI